MQRFLLTTLLVFFNVSLFAQDKTTEPPATLVEIKSGKIRTNYRANMGPRHSGESHRLAYSLRSSRENYLDG